jgi:hypothetical protein
MTRSRGRNALRSKHTPLTPLKGGIFGRALRPSPFTLRLSLFTLRLSLFTLRPSPFTLRLSPFTLRLSPFTLRPSPFTLRLALCAMLLGFAPAFGQNLAFQDLSAQIGPQAYGVYLGVSVADYDNDGDDDVYFSSQNATNLLYENLGNGKFKDVTSAAGLTTVRGGYSAVWGDIDNDGDLDLFAGFYGRDNRFYLNNGDKTFREITAAAGLKLNVNTLHCLMADVDNDGFLDIYLTVNNQGNRLYRNNGNLTFTDVTSESGAGYNGRAMGAGFFDYDKDGDVDLYLVHDYGQANHLFQNDGTGRFTNVAAQAGVDFAGDGMGVDFGDYDNDGWLDMYITNYHKSILYRNNGDATFSDVTSAARLPGVGMSWGCNFIDCDNDGWLDIFIANQSKFWQLLPTIYPNVLFHNKKDGTFSDVAPQAGLATTHDSFGSVVLDFDNDGWLDIVVADNVSTTQNEFFKNRGGSNHWLNVKLEGVQSNRSAVGARLEAFAGEWKRVDEVRAGSGYNSQSNLTVEFGLGSRAQVDSLLVFWPSGKREKYVALAVDQTLKIREGFGIVTGVTQPRAPRSLPDEFVLLQNYPNPFSPLERGATAIRYGIPAAGAVTLKVFDVLGRNVATVELGMQQAGYHEFKFEAAALHSGIYFYRLEMSASARNKSAATRYGKMIVAR